jgi:hypothetical protein
MAGPAELYRTSPETWAAHCERELGCSVEVLQEYGMREFTLVARLRNQPTGVGRRARSRNSSGS